MSNTKDNSDSTELRLQAEVALNKKEKVSFVPLSESDTLNLIQELEVHQIELEMQYDELKIAKLSAIELAENRYSELYNLSPTGYITLSKEAEIRKLNIASAKMLGRDRIFLKNSDFRYYVAENSRAIMNDFLQNVFGCKIKQTCEVTLKTDIPSIVHVKIEGILNKSLNECFATIIDVSESKKTELNLLHSIRTLKAMQKSNLLLAEATDEEKFLKDVCSIIVDDCGYKMVWIGYKQHDEQKSVKLAGHAGFEENYLQTLAVTWADNERGRGPTGTAVRTGKTTLCKDMRYDPIFLPWRSEAIKRGYSSSIALPFFINEEVFGVLTIYSNEPDPFSEEEQLLLSQLANILAYGLKTIRLNLELKQAKETLETKVKQRTSLLSKTLHDLDAERQRVLDVINIIPAFVALIDPDYGIIFSNKIYNKEFGEPNGKKCFDHLFGRSEVCLDCKIQHVLTTEEPCLIEWKGPNGRIYQKSNFPFTDIDGSYLVLEMGVDITDKKNNEQLMISKILETEETDRRRFASDLHDDLGPTLSAIRLQMSVLAIEKEDSKREELLNICDDLLSESIDKMRIIANNIMPNLLMDFGLNTAFQSFFNKMEKSCRIHFIFKSSLEECRFDEETEHHLYLIVQELVNNTIKHAGATQVDITMDVNDKELKIVYTDNGKGYNIAKLDPETSGIGLQNIGNRVSLIKGTLNFMRKGKKTFVTIKKPIAEKISLSA